MQKNGTTQAQKNDTLITVETVFVAPDDVQATLGQKDVNARRLAKVEFDTKTNTVGIGIVNTDGLDIWTKNRLGIGYRFDGFIANLIRPDSQFIFTEITTGTATFKGLDQVVKGIATVQDAKTKLPAMDLYMGTFNDVPLNQHVFLPNGKHIIMNPNGRKGIGNVRFIQNTNDLIGALYDAKGVCQGIALLPFDLVKKNPTLVLNPDAWKIVTTIPDGREFVSFGRPRFGQGGKIQIVVHFKEGFERPLTVMKDQFHQISYIWGDEAKTGRYLIGVLNGMDNIVLATMPNEVGIEIVFETYQTTDGIGRAYLA